MFLFRNISWHKRSLVDEKSLFRINGWIRRWFLHWWGVLRVLLNRISAGYNCKDMLFPPHSELHLAYDLQEVDKAGVRVSLVVVDSTQWLLQHNWTFQHAIKSMRTLHLLLVEQSIPSSLQIPQNENNKKTYDNEGPARCNKRNNNEQMLYPTRLNQPNLRPI